MTDDGSRAPRWLISITVMLTTVMVILDMTIVNVALPHMMGALGATTDQITWVLTSYIVAEAIVIPASGYLAARMGRKRLMLVSIVGFVVTSGLCGQAQTLAQIVVFRFLQGAFGASVIPLSQSIMVDNFPREQRSTAMAIWGVGVMLGPILGPTVGGIVTQHLDWRWVFYINLPVGVLNTLMILRFFEETPTRRAVVDWLGALAMAVGIGSFQVVLDRGNQEGWFESRFIVALSVVSAFTIVLFVTRAWRRSDSIVELSLLRDRNLAASCLMMFVFGIGLFGTIALLPIMLEGLFDYPVETTGLVMAPRGIASALGMFLISRLGGRVHPALVVLAGTLLTASGVSVMTWYSLSVSPYWIVLPSILQGFGMGMIFVSLSAVAYRTLPPEATDHASGIYNLARSLGSSAGISVAATLVTRATQTNWNQLGGHINPFNPALREWLFAHSLTLTDPIAPLRLATELDRQARMAAFVDAYFAVALSILALAPLVLLLRSHRPTAA